MVLMRRPEGILVQCDESIKTIIVKIDSELNDFIIEDLDDETLVIKAEKLPELKRRLNEVLKDAVGMPPEAANID
ncbi:Nucleotide excision repair TFIIH subunit TTDA [Lasiodiplodia theobromae]|uniref:General transcription and DNA repair factor IIH subunit TFB5 n=1 Tax=Lasiodiplodia theobromae TaxID=45133 RepID=A0A8H7MB48_9PEZI|nr:Nucleotide excision repair TFIIH subunit TTDA [Lasiodiplodia theobromae]KAF4534719.1 Nucleotide excision repair TFIIH subunit TTDA [Lasiodiplodia theobromae]KAF9630054.1 Nucleotide excision repair TFIIH subunit TTDA [Lasiodiplodia theobromae]